MSLSLKAIILCAASLAVLGQTPTGIVTGNVKDPTGAVVANAKIRITNKDTGLVREVTSGPDGSFSAPSLLAGNYEVRAEATGFRTVAETASVETGSTTTINLAMEVGEIKDVVTVEAATAKLD